MAKSKSHKKQSPKTAEHKTQKTVSLKAKKNKVPVKNLPEPQQPKPTATEENTKFIDVKVNIPKAMRPKTAEILEKVISTCKCAISFVLRVPRREVETKAADLRQIHFDGKPLTIEVCGKIDTARQNGKGKGKPPKAVDPLRYSFVTKSAFTDLDSVKDFFEAESVKMNSPAKGNKHLNVCSMVFKSEKAALAAAPKQMALDDGFTIRLKPFFLYQSRNDEEATGNKKRTSSESSNSETKKSKGKRAKVVVAEEVENDDDNSDEENVESSNEDEDEE